MIFSGFDVYEVYIETEVGGRTQTQMMQAPRMMLESQFAGLVEQAYNDSRPIRVKMTRYIDIYDELDKKMIRREFSVEYKNKAYE